MDKKFDPEKVSRAWSQIAYGFHKSGAFGEVKPDIVDAKDYDKLLDLYRLYKRAFELSIVEARVDDKFEDECHEADHWLKLAEASLRPPVMTDVSTVTLTGWDKSFVLEAVQNYIKGQDVGTLALLPNLLTRLQQTDLVELPEGLDVHA